MDWGYEISKTRGIDLDLADTSLFEKLVKKVPSATKCIQCGTCCATCTASNQIPFSFRHCQIMFRRGQFEHLSAELDKCMLCGKCSLACPQGVNTRAVISTMRLLLTDINDINISL